MDARLHLAFDALSLSECSPAARMLADAFGGVSASVTERSIGEPAVASRRLQFTSGGEVILHDDTIVAVVLHIAHRQRSPSHLVLSDWFPDIDDSATLNDLAAALDARPRFAGSDPFFEFGGGYLRAGFRTGRGWKEPGNLLSVTMTIDQPGLACNPQDDDCPSCSDLLLRGSDGTVDIDATVDALSAALTAELLTEDAHRVLLADVQPLHASGLMQRVECQLTCTTCRRIICFTLRRDAPPTFEYAVLNDASRHPFKPIPPVELWGDEGRIAADRAGMHYLDHEPGAWFLVAQAGALFLHARYSYSAIVDDSALIELDDGELAAYRTGGHAALSELATRIHNSAPYREDSPYFDRNLFRGPDAKQLRAAVAAAIVNRSWLAERSGG